MNKKLLYLLITSSLTGCNWRDNPPEPPRGIEGYRPIYSTREAVEKVIFTTPQLLKLPGKIYIKDDFLFVNEYDKGVHVFDNKKPEKPNKIAFYSIPHNVDIAIRGAILYADNGRDLLSIDIANPMQPKLLNRMKDILSNQDFPPQNNVNFECVDKTKGLVVGWEKVLIKDYKLNCYR